MVEDHSALYARYKGNKPILNGQPAYSGQNAVVLGRANIGRDAWLGEWSVIRADGHFVEIGADFYIGEHATIHIAHDIFPTRIGDHVTVSSGAVAHACTLEDRCVLERNAVVLDGSRIGSGSVISAGSVVFPRTELEGGWLYSGVPAKPVTRVSAAQIAAYHQKVRNEKTKQPDKIGRPIDTLECFVAPTAQVLGNISVGEGVGIWHGCRLDAGSHNITVGQGSNIQDNSSLVCETRDIVIEADVTIGHNVTLFDCTIESSSLVGIGSIIAAGTVVENDVLVAAGAQTEPGQRLTSGQVWAGRPARPIGPMDARKRSIIEITLPTYRDYAAEFRSAHHLPLNQLWED